MRKIISAASAFALVVSSFAFALPAMATTCTATGFYRDGINLTAAVINPAATVTGDVDATGCNVGVYYGPGTVGTVSAANIHGSNYYGVVVQKAAVNVQNSTIHDIGEVPLNGSQHGVGIYFATVAGLANGDCSAGATTGIVSGNTLYHYQKGGITANCRGTSVTVSNNTVTGQGAVPYIAQNGIQVGFGATGTVKNNTVTGNAYSGTNYASSAGILIYGGCGDPLTMNVSVSGNSLTGNDVGIYSFNGNANCDGAPTTKTNNNMTNNTIGNALTTNFNGWDGVSCGYQAGISDSGNHDIINNNKISGAGYVISTCTTPSPGMQSYPIDTSFWSVGAKIHKNITP